ncbi:MAG TPA: prephenate dehydrogenase/arogenate dehydrogenase family protein [Casimicrobiaceae bacterium]|nr:prephenate dehydrogenase/arogenate dehydrogenase family protein [Casimicrobiaceae bacterium]
MHLRPLDKVVVIGVGLIGGSFALAARRAGALKTVVGVGRGRANLEDALRLGLVDRAHTLDQSWQHELSDADLVMLSIPVGQIPAMFAGIAPHLGESTLVTDAGSTKQDVVAAGRAHLFSALPRFVPGHPIAGTEHSGAAAAFESLFRGKNVVLTPLTETLPTAVERVTECWRRCGARVANLDPARHDALFAAVSHLPHALAFALVSGLAARPDADEYFRYAASGFRDFTRLAASDPEMWRDICLANREAVLRELAAYRGELERVERLLAAGHGEALKSLFAAARDARRDWLEAHRGSEEV